MDAKAMGESKVLNLIFKPAGLLMGSKTRERFLNPIRTLQAANIKPGQTVLEVGCGTGFFTIPAAKLLGDQGRLIALDDITRSTTFTKTDCEARPKLG